MLHSRDFEEHRRLKLEKKYSTILKDFSYYDDESKNNKAKIALSRLYDDFLKQPPNANYTNRFFHMEYIINLIPIYTAIRNNKLARACHELRTLLHNYDFLQPRIRDNILYLLREHLKLGD